jgi:hypothetical protein
VVLVQSRFVVSKGRKEVEERRFEYQFKGTGNKETMLNDWIGESGMKNPFPALLVNRHQKLTSSQPPQETDRKIDKK